VHGIFGVTGWQAMATAGGHSFHAAPVTRPQSSGLLSITVAIGRGSQASLNCVTVPSPAHSRGSPRYPSNLRRVCKGLARRPIAPTAAPQAIATLRSRLPAATGAVSTRWQSLQRRAASASRPSANQLQTTMEGRGLQVGQQHWPTHLLTRAAPPPTRAPSTFTGGCAGCSDSS
jgi:hypothetical protein